MKLTRVIAAGIIVGSLAIGVLNAQTLRNATPPAEFPPASFKGKQYVDSRGCIYIRAGINGNITWVPRVSRSRKQICGYKPTAVVGSRPATPPKPARAPVIITAQPPANSQPAAVAPPAVIARPKPIKPVPAPVVVPTTPKVAAAPVPKPSAQPPAQRRTPSPAPPPTVFGSPKPKPAASPAPRVATTTAAPTQRRRPSPAPSATVFNAPQAAKPKAVTAVAPRSTAELSPNTRVVPRHVYDNRQNTTNVAVPKGYRSVWDDDRLNRHRAETTFQTARVRGVVRVPRGYKVVDWQDNRLNLRRGQGTAHGDEQMGQIWTNTVPRTLVRVPTRGRVVVVPANTVVIQDPQTVVTRVSTRSAPTAPPPAITTKRSRGIYVRVETYANEQQARAVANALAGTGLPTRLGATRSGGARIVLAGPFASNATARAALKQVRAAGYLSAKMSR